MTIHLPNDLEASLRAVVMNGHFASEEDAVAEIVREYFQGKQAALAIDAAETPDPLLGCMRDDAELMDEIVAEAYRQRREEPWREIDL